MPAYDVFHEKVKVALVKDGWIVTDDPLSLSVGGVDFYIDLGAERLQCLSGVLFKGFCSICIVAISSECSCF